MIRNFIRFKATDGVELQGWLSKHGEDVAVIHVHGMGGNGYENYFLDYLDELYEKVGLSFFTFDNRGRGIVSDFRQGDTWKHAGSCFEIFDESIHDIAGAISYLQSLGYNRFILQGHSLGCSKIINFIKQTNPQYIDRVILLAPTDMIAWASSDPDHDQNLARAKQLQTEGRGEELIGAQCWPLDKTPLSAQAYQSKSEAGTAVDIYGLTSDGTAPLGHILQPMLIVYGSNDIGITHPFGTIDRYQARLNTIKHTNTQLAIIEGSGHGFSGFETQLADAIERFV